MTTNETSLPMQANKRTPDEREFHRKLLSYWMKQDYTQQEMTDMLHQETGVSLSRSQIRYDMQVIRKRWLKEQNLNYHAMVNEELTRLDAMEHELWKSWRDSKGEKQKRRIEKVLAESPSGGIQDEMVVAKIVEEFKDSPGDTKFLDLIVKTQQERRRLLGLYAPSRIGVDVDIEQRTIAVKGYVGLSPSDWPGNEKSKKEVEEAIEGEYETES